MFNFDDSSSKGEHALIFSRYYSDLDWNVFGLVDYCRVSFKSIDVPFPNVQNCHLNSYYWTCHAFNELSRITGDRVEFSIMTLADGRLSINAYAYPHSEASQYIDGLIDALERGDHDSILSGELQPQAFTTRADPLKEEDYRLRSFGGDTFGAD